MRTEAEKTYDILFDTKTVNSFIDAFTGLNSVFNTFLKGLGGGMNDFVYFGSLLTNIFNKQIAGGIENSIQKLRNFNDNKKTIELFENIVKEGKAGYTDENGQMIYDITEAEAADFERASQLLKLQRSIKNEDFNRLNTLRQQIFAYDEILEKRALEDGIGSDITKKLADELASLTNKRELITDVTQKELLNTEAAKERIAILLESKASELQKVQLKTLNEKLDKGEILTEEEIQKLLKIQEEIKIKLLHLEEQKSKALEISKEHEEDETAAIQYRRDALQKEYEDETKIKFEAQEIGDIVKGISIATQLWVSGTGIVKTLFDDTLTAGEKLSQIFSVLSSSLITIALHAKDFKEIGASFVKVFAKIGIEGMVAVAAITAMVGIFVLVTDAIKESQREIEKLEQATKSFADQAEKLKNEAKEIKDTFDKYTSIEKTLESCAEGSEAWNKAIEELNKNILELTQKYPDLLKVQNLFTRDSSTNALLVNKDTLNNYLAELNNQERISQIASLSSGAKAKQLKTESSRENLLDRIINSIASTEISSNILFGGKKFTQEEFNDTRENLNKNLSSLSNLTQEEYKQQLEKIGIDKKYIDNLIKYQSQIDLLIQSTNDVSNSLKNTATLIAETDLGAWTSETEKQIYSSKYLQNYNEIRENTIKEINSLNRVFTDTNKVADLIKRYNAAMGTNYEMAQGGNFVKYGGANRQILVQNGEQTQYFTREELASGIAAGEARSGIGKLKIDEIAQEFNQKISNNIEGISELLADQILSRTFTSKSLNESTYNLIKDNIDNIDNLFSDSDWEQMGYLGQEWANNIREQFKNNWNQEEYQNFIKEQFESSLSAASALAKEKYNFDEKDFENYGRYIAEIADESEELADALEKDGQATGIVVQSIMRMNKGIEDLAKGIENWLDILKNSTKESYEYWEALDGIRKSLANILDIEEDLIDYKFIVGDENTEGHLDDITLAAEGNAEAIERLRDAYADQVILDIAANMDFTDESIKTTKEKMVEAINDIQAQIPNIDIGPVNDEDFINSLQAIIDNANMTVEDANTMFSALGFQAEYQEDNQQTTSTVPVYTTYEKINETPKDDKGEEIPGYRAKKSTFTVQTDTVTLPGSIASYSMGVTTNDGKNVRKPQIKKLIKKGTGASNNYSSRNAGGGSPGKSSGGSGGGGGSSKQPNTIDPIEKEKDRYHDVNIQLKQISNELNKLDKQKDKLFGDDLIENLNKQLEYLNQQIDTTNEKMKIAEGEAQELQGKLAASGVTFNPDGTISNYAQAYQAQLNYVNGIINQYNSMGAEAQEGFKDTVENAKENFEKFIDNINRYDEVITDLIPGLAADIQDAVDKQIDIQIEEFDMEIEIRLDMAEAERDWNEFKKKIIDGIKDDDILGNAMAKLVDFSSYYKEDDTGAAQALRKQIDNTLKELSQMDETGTSRVYGDNRTAALEDLKKYYDELRKQMQDILKLKEKIHKSYIDMMNEAQEKFDEQVKSYEMISKLVEHDKKVISMVYGEDAYRQLSAFYDKQELNYKAQLDFQKQQVEFWKEQMEAAEAGSEAWDEAKEKWAAATEELNSLIETSIENLEDKYLNAINAIFQDLNNKVTSGAGLDYVEEEWNLINKNAEQYLDNINRLYGIQALENKYLDAINDNDNIAAQRQLKRIMDEELKALRERDKLTEYDIERANKKYEIALKQIALEEAQQNKTQLRLRRDTQGNYRYEFISDIDQVNQLQNDLDDLYNSLYNFDKENYADNLNQLYDVWKEFQDKMAEAAQINDPQARAERELLIQQQYSDLINGLVEQNETIRSNLYDSAFEDLARLYDKDKNNFLQMTQAEQDAIMNDLIPYWDAGVQHMADVFAGEGGFIPTCEDAIDELHEATKEYEDGLKEVENTADISFDNIGNGIDDVIDKTQELLKDNNDLIDSYKEEMDAIGGVVNELDNLVNKYQESADAAKAAEKAAYDYWSEQQRQAAEAAARDQAEKERKAAEEAAKKAAEQPAPAPVAAAPSYSSGGDGQLNIGDTVTFSGTYYATSYGEGSSGSLYSGVAQGVIVDRINGNPFGVHIHSADGRYPALGWVRRSQLSGYDTGGYTGEWGNSGRLALLHQKELVLNQQDTRNLLNAVNIMRTITNTIGSKVLDRLATISANNGFNGGVGGVLDQNVNIQATFPNVRDHNEIEEALNNLVNRASQFVQNKER